MGGACLRGDGHHWPARGSRRAPARGWRQGQFADEPDAAGADARPQLLRAAGDPNAVDDGEPEDQPDSISNAYTVAVRISLTLGDHDCKRLCDALPIADSDRDAITVAERQPEGLDLALG